MQGLCRRPSQPREKEWGSSLLIEKQNRKERTFHRHSHGDHCLLFFQVVYSYNAFHQKSLLCFILEQFSMLKKSKGRYDRTGLRSRKGEDTCIVTGHSNPRPRGKPCSTRCKTMVLTVKEDGYNFRKAEMNGRLSGLRRSISIFCPAESLCDKSGPNITRLTNLNAISPPTPFPRLLGFFLSVLVLLHAVKSFYRAPG